MAIAVLLTVRFGLGIMIWRASSARQTLHGDLMKLDLGCGDNKREGFEGVDKFKTDSTDHVVDLLEFPWPWDDGSVEEVHCSHFFEHVPADKRARFMEELWRVMVPGGRALFITPMGDRALQDATHQWPPLVAASYLYYNKDWRVANKLQHGFYDIKADFDYTYGFGLAPNIAVRNAEFQAFAIAHYNNAASDLHVTLVRR